MLLVLIAEGLMDITGDATGDAVALMEGDTGDVNETGGVAGFVMGILEVEAEGEVMEKVGGFAVAELIETVLGGFDRETIVDGHADEGCMGIFDDKEEIGVLFEKIADDF